MAFADFLKIERKIGDKTCIHVRHLGKPRMTVEYEPGPKVPITGQRQPGVLRRVRFDNSCLADYHLCSKVLGEAEKFLSTALERENNIALRLRLRQQ